MKKNDRVKIIRDRLAPSLVSVLPWNIFYNTAVIKTIIDDRIQVEVLGQSYWFYAEDLEPEYQQAEIF